MDNPNAPNVDYKPPQPPTTESTTTINNNNQQSWSGNGGIEGSISSSMAEDDERFLNEDFTSNSQIDRYVDESRVGCEVALNKMLDCKQIFEGGGPSTSSSKINGNLLAVGETVGKEASKSEKMASLLSMNGELEKMKKDRLLRKNETDRK